jgi:type I restriction enzyme M protein
VPASEIRENNYDLSLKRYQQKVYEEVKYESPKMILQKLRVLEEEIRKDLAELEGMLV